MEVTGREEVPDKLKPALLRAPSLVPYMIRAKLRLDIKTSHRLASGYLPIVRLLRKGEGQIHSETVNW
jgi:hypothetical protein